MILLFVSCTEDQNQQHKILRYNQGDQGLSSLDPAFARSQPNMRAITQLFNGLVELDNELKVRPAIAKNWTISPNGLVYTFYLNEGVLFHDDEAFISGKGREVTAEDFVYSFKRILDSNTASPGAWIFNNKVLADKSGNASDTCFKAKDKYVLQIILQQPFPAFLEILSMNYASVVPKEATMKYGKDFRVHPVGTGPFKFKQWDEGSTLIFLKNPHFWRKDSLGNSLPYLDAIQVSFINDKTLAFLTFSQKKLDFLIGIEDNSPELFLEQDGSMKEDLKSKFIYDKSPYLYTEYLGFQLDSTFYKDKKHPFFNKKVRQALSYAINREELIAYLRFNLGIPGVNGMVPTALPSFAVNKTKGYDYDPKKAGRLLKEAGYEHPGDVPEIKLYTSAPYKYIAEYLQKQWSDLGLKIQIEVNQASTHREMMDKGIAHFFRASWIGDYPDAENYLSLFYSKNFTPSGSNKCHYKNPAFDVLYEKAIEESNSAKRNEMYKKLDQIVMNDCPVIVLFYEENIRLTQPYVKGLQVNAMNMINLEKVDIVKQR